MYYPMVILMEVIPYGGIPQEGILHLACIGLALVSHLISNLDAMC